MKFAFPFLALVALAACTRHSDTPTAEESRQLDNASELLNQAPQNLEGVDDSGLNSDSAANQP